MKGLPNFFPTVIEGQKPLKKQTLLAKDQQGKHRAQYFVLVEYLVCPAVINARALEGTMAMDYN